MSDYQARKALAQELQRKKEQELRVELEAKRAKEKQVAKEEAERKRQREALAKEARRKELLQANAALNRSSDPGLVQNGEWNPFAEDQFVPRPKTGIIAQLKREDQARAKSAKDSSGPRSARSGPSTERKSQPGPSKKRPAAERKGSPPPLGRKAKAALAFAQSAKKTSTHDSIFDLRSLVDRKNSPAPQRGSPVPTAGPSRLNGNAKTVNGSTKREWSGSGANGDPGKPGASGASLDRPGKESVEVPKTARPKGPPVPSSARRRRSQSSITTSEDSPPPKRPRPREPNEFNPHGNGHDPEPSQASISAEIQAMFRRPGVQRTYDQDSDGSSDMEAGLSDVEEEELRASRIARREDELAEREEAERKRKKEELKRMQAKEGR